jgi:hypothetical protein
MKAYEFDEDTVVTSGSLDDAKRWYHKEFGNEPDSIRELNPKTDTIFCYPAKDKKAYEVTLVPINEAGFHQFSVIEGEIFERVTIEEACKRESIAAETFIIASSEH